MTIEACFKCCECTNTYWYREDSPDEYKPIVKTYRDLKAELCCWKCWQVLSAVEVTKPLAYTVILEPWPIRRPK